MEGVSTAEVLDNERPRAVMLTKLLCCSQDQERVSVEVDSSGMRKMQPGDTLVLKDTTIQNGGYHIAGTVLLFFKE